MKPQSWSTKMKNLMQNLGLNSDWVRGFSQLSYAEWSGKVDKILEEKYIKEWKINCLSNSKLELYSKYGGGFGPKKYLEHSNISQRDKMAQLRSGTSNLRIELGRREKIPKALRSCMLCREGTEDEEHFLMEYPYYNQPRRETFQLITDHINILNSTPLKEKWSSSPLWFLFGSSIKI